MKEYLLFLLLFLIFACSSEETDAEIQGYDPLVGSWDVIRLDTNENRDRIIYRPEGTWTSLLSVNRGRVLYTVALEIDLSFSRAQSRSCSAVKCLSVEKTVSIMIRL